MKEAMTDAGSPSGAMIWPMRALRLVRHARRLMSERRIISAALNAQRFVALALKNRRMVTAAMENPDFVASALAHREHLATQISIKLTADQRIAEFKCEFDRFAAQAQAAGNRLPIRWEDRYPCLDDRTVTTPFDRHYLYHPAWAARVLARTRPQKHVDISSIAIFCSIVSAFVPVDFYDFRPAKIALDGLYCGGADLTKLPFADGSIRSLSCMHTLEHIGLGRYGDQLDPDADRKSIHELVRVLAPGGDLLVATPVGQPHIRFNAHRVYDYQAFLEEFAPLELVEFALIEEIGDGGLVISPSPEQIRLQTYGCGCFWLRKPA